MSNKPSVSGEGWGSKRFIAEEVGGFYRDLRPYVSQCAFPDCTHTHEDDCAVKNAVADGRLDERRYDSYCHLIGEDEPGQVAD